MTKNEGCDSDKRVEKAELEIIGKLCRNEKICNNFLTKKEHKRGEESWNYALLITQMIMTYASHLFQ